MRRVRMLIGLGVTLICISGAAAAAAQEQGASPARSFEELSGRLAAGEKVKVLQPNGTELRGRLRGFDSGRMVVTIGGAQVVLEEQDVRAITWKEKDPLSNGVLIGMGVGAGGALGFSALVCLSDYCNLTNAGAFLFPLAIGALGGVAVGALIDYAIRTDRLVYERAGRQPLRWDIAPILTRNAHGAALVIRF